MNTALILTLCLHVNIGSPTEQPTGAEAFNKAMSPVVQAYLQIQATLAADSIKGVPKSASLILKSLKAIDTAKIKGPNAEHYASLPNKMGKALEALLKSPNLRTVRQSFLEVSRPITMWASTARPKGTILAFCSMADNGKGGGWLQKEGPLRNPYYGSAMLECGEIVK
ncbi:MAG: DUF3347 domain-containing protein [Myxococcota bacterium]|nr:DUF3347 domain-containing protein [Myxococcota bacterium]